MIKLEQNAALKLTSTKYIPPHFANTQFGLDASQTNKSAPVFVASPVDLPRPPQRSGSYQGRSGSRAGPQTRPTSPGIPRPAESTQRSRRDQEEQRYCSEAEQCIPANQSSTAKQCTMPTQPWQPGKVNQLPECIFIWK